MKHREKWRVATLVLLWMATSDRAGAVLVDQVDDFGDGTTSGWTESGSGISPNPPVVVADGGPLGPGDAYLENVSSGVGFAGSAMVMFNTAQWSGDYLTEGVVELAADMVNLGENDLKMRVALSAPGSTTTTTWYASTDPVDLVADGRWQRVSFGLTEDDLVCVNSCGGATLDDLLSDVAVLRILSSSEQAFPILTFHGESIAATLGMDNLTALGVQEFLLGDMDVNQIVDFDDISPFVLALGDPAAYENEFGVPPIPQGDTNFDGIFDFDDISGFVDLLSGGSLSAQAVPEPSTGLLLASLFVGLSAVSGPGRAGRQPFRGDRRKMGREST